MSEGLGGFGALEAADEDAVTVLVFDGGSVDEGGVAFAFQFVGEVSSELSAWREGDLNGVEFFGRGRGVSRCRSGWVVVIEDQACFKTLRERGANTCFELSSLIELAEGTMRARHAVVDGGGELGGETGGEGIFVGGKSGGVVIGASIGITETEVGVGKPLGVSVAGFDGGKSLTSIAEISKHEVGLADHIPTAGAVLFIEVVSESLFVVGEGGSVVAREVSAFAIVHRTGEEGRCE